MHIRDVNQHGHEVDINNSQNSGTVIQSINNVESMNIENADFAKLGQDIPGNVGIVTNVSGTQSMTLQLPNDSKTILEVIDGLIERGYIESAGKLVVSIAGNIEKSSREIPLNNGKSPN